MKADLSQIPDQNKNGNCYHSAFDYFLNNSHSPDLRLVHGLPTGQGAIKGIVYGHAWCEDEFFVYDQGKVIPKNLYYSIGNINVSYSYTLKEAMLKVQQYETYGAWEKEILENEY